MTTSDLDEVRTDQSTDTYRGEPGDADRFAHYVRKHELEQSFFTGEPIEALCGKKWLPTRDAQRFPVCPDCRAAWEAKDDA